MDRPGLGRCQSGRGPCLAFPLPIPRHCPSRVCPSPLCSHSVLLGKELCVQAVPLGGLDGWVCRLLSCGWGGGSFSCRTLPVPLPGPSGRSSSLEGGGRPVACFGHWSPVRPRPEAAFPCRRTDRFTHIPPPARILRPRPDERADASRTPPAVPSLHVACQPLLPCPALCQPQLLGRGMGRAGWGPWAPAASLLTVLCGLCSSGMMR